MRYRSIKRYGHECGFSCAFRQWRADSHCALIHGYALAVTLEFGADALDERNWVMDFGGLGYAKKFLGDLLDHTLLVAADDPSFKIFEGLAERGLARVRVMPNVGCEALAEYIFTNLESVLGLNPAHRVKLLRVTVSEHGANSASYGEG